MNHAMMHAVERSREYELELEIKAGVWPPGLHGHAFVLGPAQPTTSGFVWAGGGLLTRVDLATRGPRWTTRRVVTPEIHTVGALAARLDRAEVPRVMAGAAPGLSNVSMHFLGKRMLLTSDVGRPVEVDPLTMRYLSYAGGVREYPAVSPHPLFPGVVCASHPVEDVDLGCLWWSNYRLLPLGRSRSEIDAPLHVVRWDGEGDLDTWYVPGARLSQLVHEITVTERHVIFVTSGILPEPGAQAGRGRTRPHAPYADIYIVAKADLTRENRGKAVPCARARLPYEAAHHFADYREDGDDITLYVAHSNGWDINLTLTQQDTVWGSKRPLDPGQLGFLPAPCDASPVGRYVIDGRTGEVKDRKMFLEPERHWGTIFYARNPARAEAQHGTHLWQTFWGLEPEALVTSQVNLYRDHPYRVVPVERLADMCMPSTIACLRLDDMSERSAHQFPEGSIGQSPIFVPDKAGGDGWVLCFVQHPERTELQVFDAFDLAKGPVAVAGAPGLKLSFQAHSGWIPALEPRTSTYFRSYGADLDGAWKDLPPSAREIVAPIIAAYS